MASVNGLPFAKVDCGYTVPIAFRAAEVAARRCKPPKGRAGRNSAADAAKGTATTSGARTVPVPQGTLASLDLRNRLASLIALIARLVRDHLFEALEIGHERRLVDHAHLADDRRAIGEDA